MSSNQQAMTEAERLLPCPFCGSQARQSYSRDGEITNIRCMRWGNGCLGAGSNEFTTKAAIEAWNTRTLASQPANGVGVEPQPTSRADDGVSLEELRVMLKEAVDKLASSSPAPGWQPIETAPKDGCPLLLATANGIVFIGKRNKHLHIWVDDEGRERFRGVAHWMHLPAGPQEKP